MMRRILAVVRASAAAHTGAAATRGWAAFAALLLLAGALSAPAALPAGEGASASPPLVQAESPAPTLIALVRHAERDGPSASDPGLTPVGEERARALARLLAETGIDRIHASRTRRAIETAEPLARLVGAAIEPYDPRGLEAFARRLASEPGRHLVVGHSNTTDELSLLLGGRSFGPVEEDWEYDRLYLLTPRSGGGFETVLLRFGPAVHGPSIR